MPSGVSARAQSVQVKHINVTGTEAWISSDNAPWLADFLFSIAHYQVAPNS